MSIAVLVKQVPRASELEFDDSGRLRRDRVELEMNAYCRRAVGHGVTLAHQFGGRCVAITLGPPPAEDVLREAIAWGVEEGIHIVDPLFAGADTLVTARALAAALRVAGPFDLILLGRNSVDADTGQVGPQVAELLDLPFAVSARSVDVGDGTVTLGCEVDDGDKVVRLTLPALVSVAERLCQPAKAVPALRAAVPAASLRRLTAADLGMGQAGQTTSPTIVGATRVIDVDRHRLRPHGSVADQVHATVELLEEWGVLGHSGDPDPRRSAPQPYGAVESGTATPRDGHVIVVLAEPGRDDLLAGLIAEAHVLALGIHAEVVVAGPEKGDPHDLWRRGADRLIHVVGSMIEEDVVGALVPWCQRHTPWAVLAPGTVWAREVAARLAASLGVGMVGDAISLDVSHAGRLVCWKPALTGRVEVEVTTSSTVQVASVRVGGRRLMPIRTGEGAATVAVLEAPHRGRVTLLDHQRDPSVSALLTARRIVGVGAGVVADDVDALRPLLEVLDAELAATRRVTDQGWLPRARQVGITGHQVAPDLYLAIGVSGKFNHMVGVRGARAIVAINADRDALVFEEADIAIVGDWRAVVPVLAAALGDAMRTVATVRET